MLKFHKWMFVSIISIVTLCILFVTGSKNLEGYHLISNIQKENMHTFYLTAQATGAYKFHCKSTFENIEYEVYDAGSDELIESNSFGREVEGYYPFMSMQLTEGHKYEVKIRVMDDSHIGTLVVKLKSIN